MNTGPDAGARAGNRTRGNPLRRLYHWVLGWADRPGGPWALAAFAFAESSFFPVPPDILLIPLCLAAPRRALLFAGLCTGASVVGGMFGYLLGAAAFESVGRPMLELYGALDGFERLSAMYQAYDAWAVAAAGFTPIPYKVFTISAGFFDVSFPVFVVASVIGRGGRFFLVAGLLTVFGERVREFVERWFNWLTVLLILLVAAGFAVLHYGVR